MKSYAADKVRNVVLLGHSGSGKTTYAEAALFYSGATKRFGKVDEGNTVSDYDPEEIRRKGIYQYIRTACRMAGYKDQLLGYAGYFDFVAESKLAMSVADTALIMVSAKSGVSISTVLPVNGRIQRSTSGYIPKSKLAICGTAKKY